jgi:uncharacterized protein YegJ (DUF2314 family)
MHRNHMAGALVTDAPRQEVAIERFGISCDFRGRVREPAGGAARPNRMDRSATIRTVAVLTILGAAAYTVSPRSQTISDAARSDGIVNVAKGDPDMTAAMGRARASLPEFFAFVRDPTPRMSGFSVKVAVRDGSQTEFFCIMPFERKDENFSGQINNRPRTVHNVTFGQTIAFAESEIVDWMYMDGDKMKGSYTTCAILKKEPRKDADAMMKRYGLACDL